MMLHPRRDCSSKPPAVLLATVLLRLLCISTAATALSSSSNGSRRSHPLVAANRPKVLDLLNHPLQLQLATGDLSDESFRRLVRDRRAILEGLVEGIRSSETNIDTTIDGHSELEFHDRHLARLGVVLQEKDGSSSNDDDETSIFLDVTDDSGVSQSATVLASVLRTNGLAGAATVLRCYGFCCDRLRVAQRERTLQHPENGSRGADTEFWLRIHAERWSELAERCEDALAAEPTTSEALFGGREASSSSSLCLSLLYNWIDTEAGTSGIRADLVNDPEYKSLANALEALEPGYQASRDKHASFVADLTGKATSAKLQTQAEAKRMAAAAYLAAKQQPPQAKTCAAASKAKAYLAAKTKAETAAAYLDAKKKKKNQP